MLSTRPAGRAESNAAALMPPPTGSVKFNIQPVLVHQGELYKRGTLHLRYRRKSVMLYKRMGGEQHALHFGDPGGAAKVVRWEHVKKLTFHHSSCDFDVVTSAGVLRFRADSDTALREWEAVLPAPYSSATRRVSQTDEDSERVDMPSARLVSAFGSFRRGPAVAGGDRRGKLALSDPGSPNGSRTEVVGTPRTPGDLTIHKRSTPNAAARWVVDLGSEEFASAIETMGHRMTAVRPRAESGAGAQAGGHEGALRPQEGGTIHKESTVGEALFYEKDAPAACWPPVFLPKYYGRVSEEAAPPAGAEQLDEFGGVCAHASAALPAATPSAASASAASASASAASSTVATR